MAKRFRRRPKSERGAALIEFSLLFMFLMMIALGAFEWGMAFRDTLAVSSATREAARVAGAVGDRVNGDCTILEAAAGALQSIAGNDVEQIWVYQSDTSGAISGTEINRYRPAQVGDVSLVCNNGWFVLQYNWPEPSRDNDGQTRDWLGVRTVYSHVWKTNFLWWNGSVQWFEDAVMHLEPSLGIP